jgi:chaperone modulatory protein CbpM
VNDRQARVPDAGADRDRDLAGLDRGQLFSEADLARAALIRDLKDDLGVNDEGVAVVLGLVDQIHGLRRTLSDLLQAVRAQPEAVQRQIANDLRGVEPPSSG